MDDLKRTTEYRKLLPFIAKASNDVGDDTQGEDIQALILALNAHKSSTDHDGRYSLLTHLHDDRYYTEGETDTLLGYKADKTLTLTAGNGLTGGGDLSANRTFAVGAGLGISVAADAVAIDLTANLTWTGGHTFSGSLTTGSIMPALSDTYDLGDYTKPWRKIWGSELSAVVFSQYEQVLLGGWLTISKGEGKLAAAVASTDTEIDLGAGTFAENDILVFRSISSNGTPQVEYMKVGTLVSGTTYNVTRDLDGTGANNWPDGTVYGNWGQVGNGRIELNAYDTPRMSVYSQGATYNSGVEQIRIGDLNGNWGYSSSVFGGAFGSYESGKANITIDPTNGIRIRNYNVDVIKLTGTEASFENFITLGASGGIRQGTGTWGASFTGTAIWSESSVMNIGGWNAGVKQWWGGSDGRFYANGGLIQLGATGLILNSGITDGDGRLSFQINGLETVDVSQVIQVGTYVWRSGLVFTARYVPTAFPSGQGYTYSGPKISLDVLNSSQALSSNLSLTTETIYLGTVGGPAILFLSSANQIEYSASGGHTFVGPITGTISEAVNADKLDGYHVSDLGGRLVWLTSPLTSASWNWTANSTTGKTLIDMSAVFGAPANIKAILFMVGVRDSGAAGADTYLILSPNNTNFNGPSIDPNPINDRYTRGEMIVPCNVDGDIYYQIGASGAGTFDVLLQVFAYWI